MTIRTSPNAEISVALVAKSGGKVTQILVTLTSAVHHSLSNYASAEETNLDDAARLLIEDSLATKGFLED